ncbi:MULTISPECIES: HU family DNA-binding protein [unclassified Lactococcus]|uniref:HU family DNA-binding protein n=1 Tax=unclassified Lactococcus TaxID=2643510 RepID=UPI0011C767AA|nr:MULTISPECIES: HU family DNA-binding protein [unclassified Lactococcus]MQW23443.1 integration host factor subunit alpha [Lactococcus sp. dk101]TXK37045.1 HU family DNA-binding protein [Lactococcus sp. dk310]TXK37277.1 HU family DNA-binding protein [Lactococcus sp. dk310]TXK46069.1 HU family DNA-binding protein [Lactococcus sp. dk322]
MANKKDLVASVSEKSGLTQKKSEKAINALTESIIEVLVKHESAQLVGFGVFETKERKARTGRNPQSGEAIEIAAATVPAFKAGKLLKEAVKNNK